MREAAHALVKQRVKRLREEAWREAFVKEWPVAKLAWIERREGCVTNPTLLSALKQRLQEVVVAYDGDGDVRFVDYKMTAIEMDHNMHSQHSLTSTFLRGLQNRMKKNSPKFKLFGKQELTPHEKVEIMDAVNKACWSLSGDLAVVLEAIRPRVTPELMDLP